MNKELAVDPVLLREEVKKARLFDVYGYTFLARKPPIACFWLLVLDRTGDGDIGLRPMAKQTKDDQALYCPRIPWGNCDGVCRAVPQ
jgi:hypothetical protein